MNFMRGFFLLLATVLSTQDSYCANVVTRNLAPTAEINILPQGNVRQTRDAMHYTAQVGSYIPYVFPQFNSETERKNQLRLQEYLREAKNCRHPLADGFAHPKFNENEFFTQDSWGKLTQKPLLVALVFSRSSKTNELNIALYRAHDFNQWLIGASEYETRSFRVDPLTREKLLSSNVFYFTLTRDSLIYLCALDELIAHNSLGETLRQHFLENAGNDATDRWYARGINHILVRNNVIAEIRTMHLKAQGDLREFQGSPQNAEYELRRSINLLVAQLTRAQNSPTNYETSQQQRYTTWRNETEAFLQRVSVPAKEFEAKLPKNPVQRVFEFDTICAEAHALYQRFLKLSGEPAHQASLPQQVAHNQPIPENREVDLAANEEPVSPLEASLLCTVAPLAIAFGHGLVNNLLARWSGNLILPQHFYKAPIREWITGTVALTAHAALTKYVNSKLKKSEARTFWLCSYMSNTIHMGFIQLLGETIPLSRQGEWRLQSSPYSKFDLWFNGNLSMTLTRPLFELENKVVSALYNNNYLILSSLLNFRYF